MDTVFVLKDTICAHVVKVADTCQPCIHEAETNWIDFAIVLCICLAIGAIVSYGIYEIFEHKNNERTDKANAESGKRENELNDRKWKLKANLMEKLLDYLKSKTSDNSSNKVQLKNNGRLSINNEEIYKLLKENVAISDSNDLKKQYVELCIDILQKLEKGRDGDASDNQNPSKEQSSKETMDYYLDALCNLLCIICKEDMGNEDANNLRESCGLPRK